MKKVCQSNAKINLCLYVLNQRADGYHNIFTVFQEITLHDILTVTVRNPNAPLSIEFECDHPDLPKNDENLVVKAARLLGEMYGGHGNVHLKLEKRIPMGSGLGGGSSNAAHTLLALNELWNLNLTPNELMTYARSMGADIPFFLFGGTAIGREIGDKLEIIQTPYRKWLLLVDPKISISTLWAYKNIKLALTNAEQNSNFGSKFPDILSRFHNDFEALVFPNHPVLAEIKNSLLESGAENAAMSGSGSAVFGVYGSEKDVNVAFQQLEKKYPEFRVFTCETVPTAAA